MTGRVCSVMAAFTVDVDGPTDPHGSQWLCTYKYKGLCFSGCLLLTYTPDLEAKDNYWLQDNLTRCLALHASKSVWWRTSGNFASVSITQICADDRLKKPKLKRKQSTSRAVREISTITATAPSMSFISKSTKALLLKPYSILKQMEDIRNQTGYVY